MAADAHDAGPAGAFKQHMQHTGQLMLMMLGQLGFVDVFRQHALQLMLMMLSRLGLLGNTRGS